MTSKMQAVVVIHGIGEQKPMATLRGFVEAVWTRDAGAHNPHIKGQSTFSKPDAVSRSYELRRLTTVSGKNGWRTDFYEFYWAHLMHSTTFSHLLDWFRFLMWRWPGQVPRSLLPHYLVLWIVALVYGGLAYTTVSPGEALPRFASVTVGAFIAPVLFRFLKDVLGDAARYLLATPANVQRRQEIRAAGVELLHSLHQQDYARIVIVGHSLGSVIGYDILTHAWTAYDDSFEARRPYATEALESLEGLTRGLQHGGTGEAVAVDDVQAAQSAYFRELRDNGCRWRVTDFVTMGCPLAHARLLLAKSDEAFERMVADRELPTCPPVLETVRGMERFSYARRNEKGNRTRVIVPHHAAVFSATRWTNLFFPVKDVLWGDFIAGPLRGVLGKGIRDVPVHVDAHGDSGLLSHTRYWRMSDTEAVPPYLVALREALDIAHDRAANDAPPPAAGGDQGER